MVSSFLRLILTSMLLLVFFVAPILSQEITSTHQIGLSASLQDNQIDFLVPIWLGSRVTIAPSFGVTWIQDAGTDLHFGVIPKFYFSNNKVSPFISFRAALLRATPSVGDGVTDWLLGLSFGGEYFVDENFSIGIETQFNYTISDKRSTRFGNPGKNNLNTATAIFASIYF
jgi:hypothetical protein